MKTKQVEMEKSVINNFIESALTDIGSSVILFNDADVPRWRDIYLPKAIGNQRALIRL